MRNVLVISGESKEIAGLFKSIKISAGEKGMKPKSIPVGTDHLNPLQYDLALLDLDVQEWKQRLMDLRQFIPVIAFSTPNLKRAVEAMKLGATDYLEKPLTSEVLTDVIKRHKKKVLNSEYGFDETIGTSRLMQEVFGLIKRAGASESNVLITGESGTGKELVARAIHKWSPRSERSFAVINCSAIPDTLLESELFGFEKGSFTGANYTKKGLLEIADKGTVFLDEIGDVSPLFQAKILRVLQEGEIMRIGGSEAINVDLRIISATNRELDIACKKGIFREDLFYRLNVINIHLPPLRNRIEDIPALVKHFIEKHAHKRKDLLIKDITEDAMEILKTYSYPGNIRELENIIERAVSFADSPQILPSDLPPGISQFPSQKINPSLKLKETLRNVEKELIWSSLQKSGGNISKAASELGIHRQQLQRKLRVLKIET
ncbi:MAG TPA: sigma-54 dependent transcriptional regulator [Thermodesulfovibrionales bacterium]|nr:sigma-54 dependent transcriptional regulator [Thermodesulfovibrionales bacterium]